MAAGAGVVKVFNTKGGAANMAGLLAGEVMSRAILGLAMLVLGLFWSGVVLKRGRPGRGSSGR
jgi:hypothetical protein